MPSFADSDGNFRIKPTFDVTAGEADYVITQGTGEQESRDSNRLTLELELPAVAPSYPAPGNLGNLPQGVISHRILPSGSVGANLNALRINNYDKANLKQFAKACAECGVGTWRWPGGDTGNFFDFTIERVIQNSDTLPGNNTYSHTNNSQLPLAVAVEVYREDITFARLKEIHDYFGLGLDKCNWVINVLTQTPAQAIAGLRKAEALGFDIAIIELGNELYFNQPNYTGNRDGIQYYQVDENGNETTVPIGHITNTAYAEDMRDRWIPALRAAFPGVLLYAVGAENASFPVGSARAHFFVQALDTAGLFNRNSGQYVDGITIHPYITTPNIGASLEDIGSTPRAAQFAIQGHNEGARLMASDSLNLVPDWAHISITEWGYLEGSNVANDVVLGDSWICALMLNNFRIQQLADPRVVQSMLHTIIAAPQWSMMGDENGTGIDPAKYGVESRPYTQGIYPRLQPTTKGKFLGISANEVINPGGIFDLLINQPGYVAARVSNPGNDGIVVINGLNSSQFFYPPEGGNWTTTQYTAEPWLLAESPGDFPEPVTSSVNSGGGITVLPFSLMILKGDGNAGRVNNSENDVDRSPPQVLVSEVTLRRGLPFTVDLDFTSMNSVNDIPAGWDINNGDNYVFANNGVTIPAPTGDGFGKQRISSLRSPSFRLRNGQVIEIDFLGAEAAEKVGAYVGLNIASLSNKVEPVSFSWFSNGTFWLYQGRDNERLTTGVLGAKQQFRLFVSNDKMTCEFRRDDDDGRGYITYQEYQKIPTAAMWQESLVTIDAPYVPITIQGIRYS